jgi:D-alanine-D-alanine ligase
MKKKIALLAGGYTGESVVSMKSAAMVANSLDRNVYEDYQIVINKEKWVYINEQKENYYMSLDAICSSGLKLSADNKRLDNIKTPHFLQQKCIP